MAINSNESLGLDSQKKLRKNPFVPTLKLDDIFFRPQINIEVESHRKDTAEFRGTVSNPAEDALPKDPEEAFKVITRNTPVGDILANRCFWGKKLADGGIMTRKNIRCPQDRLIMQENNNLTKYEKYSTLKIDKKKIRREKIDQAIL